MLEGNRACFNIRGNSYRLIVKINFLYQMMWIRFIGTNSEYDRIEVKKYKIMNIKPIKIDQDYYLALDRLEEMFDSETNIKEGNELEILSILIEKFENGYFPIEYPDPIEAINLE